MRGGLQRTSSPVSEDASEGGLGDLAGRKDVVLDLDDAPVGIDDPEVDNGVDAGGDVVAGNDVLGGTSMVTVLRSILTILSTSGHNRKSPGPFGPPWTRPRRKITPRSYSLTTLRALIKT